MRWLIILLSSLFLFLQYGLWLGDRSLPDAWQLQTKIENQMTENTQLEERNRLLEAEVKNLKQGLEVVEEKARIELGLIKPGETFYQVIEPALNKSSADSAVESSPDSSPIIASPADANADATQ